MRLASACLLLALAAPGCTLDEHEGTQVALSFRAAAASSPLTGELTVASVELVACPSVAQRLWNELGLLGVAHAHGDSSSTRRAVPTVLSLARDAASQGYGTVAPPAGSWCSATVTFGPADADAEGLPSDGTVFVGTTLRAQQRTGSVTWRSAASRSVVVAFPRLTLDDDHLNGQLTFTLPSPTADELSGLDGDALLARLASGLTATAGSTP